jgi:tRNA(His) guanylyltransferase
MAKSRFEYVKAYELADNLLPNTFLVVRVDGHAFHK